MFDESSVQALIKAAVNSALQFADLNKNTNYEKGSIDTAQATESQQQLLSGRLSIVEDRIDGLDVVQQSQLANNVSIDAFLSLKSLVAQLEGRLKTAEEYILQTESQKRSIEDQARKDQTALKEYIIRMEENQRLLISRIEMLETTLESDSETSIGLLDMLLKKISSRAVDERPPSPRSSRR
jgi:tRNA A22 N-methylase